MEIGITHYSQAGYIETETGNKISRKSTIYGSQNIILGGKTIIKDGVVLRGDLKRSGVTADGKAVSSVAIAIGKYTVLESDVEIIPPEKSFKGVKSYYPLRIGDHVHIGSKSIVEAASIGNSVYIGKNVQIKGFVIIKDGAVIMDNSIVSANTVVPSFSIFKGSPAKHIETLSESFLGK